MLRNMFDPTITLSIVSAPALRLCCGLCYSLFPLLSFSLPLSLDPSGTQHAPRVNTHKQTLPIIPGQFMWDGVIKSLRSIVSIAPCCTSQTQRKHTSEVFTQAFIQSCYFSFICNEEASATLSTPFFI